MRAFFILLVFTCSVLANDVRGVFKKLKISTNKQTMIVKIANGKKNTLSTETIKEIRKAVLEAIANSKIKAVVITGNNGVFSSGSGFDAFSDKKDRNKEQSKIAHNTFALIEKSPILVIALVNGLSAGGGNELALACDIRIASKSAKFRHHELQMGLVPGFGGMQRLPMIIGRGRAMEMMLSGRLIGADEAKNIGLVSAVVEDENLLKYGIDYANKMANIVDKTALKIFKGRMYRSYNEPHRLSLKNDRVVFDKLADDPQTKRIAKEWEKKHFN